MLASRLFRVPPFDERITSRTELELARAVEAELMLRGEEAWQCPACDGWTYDVMCPCGYVDPVDQLVASGADVDAATFEKLWSGKRGA